MSLYEPSGETVKLDFKACAALDIDAAFLNLTEHAETHDIDGKEMPVIIEESTLVERNAHWEGGAKQSFDSGVYKARTVLYVKPEDYGPKPKIGKQLVLDKKRTYTIVTCNDEVNLYKMTLERNRQ